MKVEHPYPGLRPFERHESRIFFGREKHVDELLARLKDHHFLAVLGASGSGKSSLVKAGLLPALAKGYMGEVGADWSIAELRPADQPFARLAEALLQDERFQRTWRPSTMDPGDHTGKKAQDLAFLAAALRRRRPQPARGVGTVAAAEGDAPPDRCRPVRGDLPLPHPGGGSGGRFCRPAAGVLPT